MGLSQGTPLIFPEPLLRRWPHLPAFWPERARAAAGTPGAVTVAPDGEAGVAGPLLRFSLGPFAPPRFGDRDAPVLLIAEGAPPLADGEVAECAAVAAAAGLDWAAMAPWLGATRAADPFRRLPTRRAAALALLGQWRAAERANRGVAVCLGLPPWKRRPVAALLAHGGGGPAFVRDEARAKALAGRGTGAREEGRDGTSGPDGDAAGRGLPAGRPALMRADGMDASPFGDAILAWAADVTPARAARLRAAGARLVLLEDGFVRSRGLGARFLPAASYCLDERGAHYDPAQPSGLEALLQAGRFPPALLVRAAALRAAIVGRGVTKYNLPAAGALPDLPPGRRVVLVPGQVEDDASIRLGADAVRTNLDLLHAARAAEPGAVILYKPHPDLEAGFRRGRLRARELAGLADHVLSGVPLPQVLPHVHALHTITSLSGFEAVLRDVPVVTWGRPFYAGWGLTTDRGAPFPAGRRGVARTVDELVAAALILYPRYLDPVTRLPCPVEVILERLDDPAAWKPPVLTLHRGVEGFVRRMLARIGGRR